MLDLQRQEIATRLDRGVDLRQVERDLIEGAVGLSDDDRAALWLFAWSYCETRPQAMVAGGQPIGS
jgi:hypothetical protein